MNWELKRPPFHGVEHRWLWFRLWGNLILWKTTTTCIRAWECTVKYSGPDEPKQKFRVCTISEVIFFSLSQPAQFSDFQAFFGEGVWRVYLCQLCSDDLDDATSSTFFFFRVGMCLCCAYYLLLLMVKSHKVTGVPANCWESLFFEGKDAKDLVYQTQPTLHVDGSAKNPWNRKDKHFGDIPPVLSTKK